MEQARMDRALNRIERALSRIERAARQSPPPAAADGSPDRALRATVTIALAELDQIIATLER